MEGRAGGGHPRLEVNLYLLSLQAMLEDRSGVSNLFLKKAPSVNILGLQAVRVPSPSSVLVPKARSSLDNVWMKECVCVSRKFNLPKTGD